MENDPLIKSFESRDLKRIFLIKGDKTNCSAGSPGTDFTSTADASYTYVFLCRAYDLELIFPRNVTHVNRSAMQARQKQDRGCSLSLRVHAQGILLGPAFEMLQTVIYI
jgi:hypothetical protein